MVLTGADLVGQNCRHVELARMVLTGADLVSQYCRQVELVRTMFGLAR
jgi:hypothetical protein